MKVPLTVFNAARARPFRKVSEVLAFRCNDAFEFHKRWGRQHVPGGGWILIPLRDGRPTGDAYGCHEDSFESTYRPAGGGRLNTYEKHAIVHAYQPGMPFSVRTVVGDHVEVDPAAGNASDWLVRNPSGDHYVVSDETFRATYLPV